MGWSRERQFRRLKLVANNSRFLVLNGGGARNLASRVLGLSVGRLSSDMEEAHGFPVLVAETFVDPSRFRGTCYRASNWTRLGETRGYTRLPGRSPVWRRNGNPKEVWVCELSAGGREALSGSAEPEEWGMGEKGEAMDAEGLRSLHAYLSEVPEYRSARGIRYPLSCYLTIMIAARLAGYRGVAAFGEFAERLTEEQRRAVGAFRSPSKGRYTVPAVSTFHHVLSKLPPEALEEALRGWSARCAEGGGAVAVDGKDVRGASKRLGAGEREMMVAAVEHGSGVVLGQARAGDRGEEGRAVRELCGGLDLRGRTVTLDALHACRETARRLVEDCGADYVATVKGNQKRLLKDLEGLDWESAERRAETRERGHGREEWRRCAAIDLSGAEWDGVCALPGRAQALRIERRRTNVKRGGTGEETVYCVSSLGADTGAEEMLRIVRGHWEIENRLHYVRDFTYDEDRCRAAAGHLPRNLAALTNAAVSIIRLEGRFDYVPPANRHYAARAGGGAGGGDAGPVGAALGRAGRGRGRRGPPIPVAAPRGNPGA